MAASTVITPWVGPQAGVRPWPNHSSTALSEVMGRLTLAPGEGFVMNRTLWIGVFPGLNTTHLGHIVESLEEFFGMGFWVGSSSRAEARL